MSYFDDKKIVKGNIVDLGLNGHFDVIVHGCNCFHTMGAGLAKELREKIPLVYETDKMTAVGSETKMGKYSSCQVIGNTGKLLTIINAYTQHRPSPPVEYDAIEEVFNTLGIVFKNTHIAYPKIGAGLAKGDWNLIEPIIDKALCNVYAQTLVEFG